MTAAPPSGEVEAMSGAGVQRPEKASRRSLWKDRRGAVFAEYVIVFATVGLAFMAAAAAVALSMANSYYYKLLFLSVDGIQ